MPFRLTGYKTVAVAATALGLCTACFYGGGPAVPPPPPPLTLAMPSQFLFNAAPHSPTAPQVVTVINSGSETLTLGVPRLVFNQGQAFRIDTTCGKTLAPSAQCTISAVFQPPAVGQFHATIVVHVNKPYDAQYIYLVGSGDQGPPTP